MVHQKYSRKEKGTSHLICEYCRQTPPNWQRVGHEAICAHCGTRVFRSNVSILSGRDVAMVRQRAK